MNKIPLALSRVCFLCLFIFICGCAHERYISDPDSGVYTLAEYSDSLKLWVAHDELHKEMIGVADVYSLYKSWEVRQAFLDALKNRARVNPEYLEMRRDREVHQFRNGHEFLIGLYCYKKEWYKVTGQDPIWRFTLTNSNGDQVRPLLIEEVSIDSDEAWEYLDFMTHGRKTYRVVFPVETDSGQTIISKDIDWFMLDVNSLLGRMEMKWELGPVPFGLR